MSAATQVYYPSFDAVFLKLPGALRARIEAKIDEIGCRLESFPHHRLKGSNRFRARAWATTESFTRSTWSRIGFICLPSGIAGKFTDHKPLTMHELNHCRARHARHAEVPRLRDEG